MNLRLALVSTICMLIWLTIIPAAAQDAVPSCPLCTTDEVTLNADIATAFDDQLNSIVNKDYEHTLDSDSGDEGDESWQGEDTEEETSGDSSGEG